MKNHLFFAYLFLISITTSLLGADCVEEQQMINQISLGPEVYWLKRDKDGGAKQTGPIWGVRGGYERLKRYGWYIGADVLYATGTLDGKSGKQEKLRSQLTDTNVEGRFGYTFQQKGGWNFSFTPYFGYGYFIEQNNFKDPSPVPAHFKNTFSYFPCGFLSHVYLDFISKRLGLGFNFKTRFLTSHKIKVTHDPKFDDSVQHYTEKLQYRYELPITYDISFWNRVWQVKFEPFYEIRPYGELSNFPFDFKKTKMQLYGANLQCIFLF